MSELKQQLQSDMKDALKAKDKARLGTVRLILAAIKQKEVDERVEVTDADILSILDKMAKQRKESIAQFQKAGRDDLIAVEEYESGVILKYLPEQLSETEITQHVEQAIIESGANSIKDMGKVMAILKPIFQGRADLSLASKQIKEKLAN